MVTQPPDYTTGAHFHDVDQYQIFLGAPGAVFQRTPLDQVLVHYSDAYSTYGPFSTSTEPMRFLTFRSKATRFIGYMPQDRDKLIRRGRRNIHMKVDVASSRELAPGTTEIETLFPTQDDLVAAFCLKAGPQGIVKYPDRPVWSSGWLCIVDGDVNVGGVSYGCGSVGRLDPNNPPLALQATDTSSFCVLALHLPSNSTI
jgi:hypothetical protein